MMTIGFLYFYNILKLRGVLDLKPYKRFVLLSGYVGIGIWEIIDCRGFWIASLGIFKGVARGRNKGPLAEALLYLKKDMLILIPLY